MKCLMGFLVLTGCLCLTGCFLRTVAPPSEPTQVAEVGKGESTAKSTPQIVGQYLQAIGSAPAGLAVTKGLQPFFPVGIAFCILGGLAFLFRMKANGIILSALGVSYVAVAVLFTQYPYVVLAPVALGALMIYERLKEKRRGDAAETTVEVLAEKIEKAPEAGAAVKSAIKAEGPDVENLVRGVIGPIKTKLKKLGKIAVG